MPIRALTPVELLTLAALGDRPRYGYEIVQRIDELSQGRVRVRPGNLYRVLHRLGELGLATQAEEAAGASEDERRQYFEATREGMLHASQQLQMYVHVLGTVPELRSAGHDV